MDIPEAVLAAMHQTNEFFNTEVVSKKNIDGLDQVYTMDAHVLPPGANMIHGREKIKDFWQQAIAALGLQGAVLTTLVAESLGDRVFEIGQAVLTLGEGRNVTVKYVVQWKQEEGRWKWHVDIWNQNE